MRHILPCPQSLQLQAKTRSILHKLLQLLWHRSPFGADVYPFFLSLTALTDAPLSLSPQTPCLFCFPPFFYVEHLVLTAKYPVLQGVALESHFPLSHLVLLLHNESKAHWMSSRSTVSLQQPLSVYLILAKQHFQKYPQHSDLQWDWKGSR